MLCDCALYITDARKMYSSSAGSTYTGICALCAIVIVRIAVLLLRVY